MGAGLRLDGASAGANLEHWALQNFRLTRSGLAGPALAIGGDENGFAAYRGLVQGVTIDASSGDGIGLANTCVAGFRRRLHSLGEGCQRQ